MSNFSSIHIPLHPSRLLGGFYVVVHLVVFFFISFTSVPLWLKLSSLVLTLVSAAWVYSKYMEMSAFKEMWIEKGELSVNTQTQKMAVEIDREIMCTPFLVILPIRFLISNKTCALVFLNDSLNLDHHRQLRVLIKCGELRCA